MPQLYSKDDRATIVRKIAENIAKHNEGKYEILFDKELPAASKALSADIALLGPNDRNLILHILVETNESLTQETAAQKWQKLAAAAPLEIAVPKRLISRAKTLGKKIGVKARLIEY